MKAKSFKDLIVWQKSYKLVLEIYKLTDLFPRHEMYGLAQQIRRAAVSIPSNISEGYGRQYNKEYRQFLSIAYGSLCELETQCLLSVDLDYIKQNNVVEMLMREVGAMLYRIINPKP
ncbi:MAG: four helix bundle protein [Omnitrophica bacterium RIFOXYB12_FULL_50_7]|nr:MAG: four helix bundle protein [Omnitrophica bacterium RIFOXYB12_FULL_50_7]